MAIVRLNDKAFKAAAKLIEDGKVVKGGVASVEIGNAYQSKQSPDRDVKCIGIRTGKDRSGSEAWEYPIIDADKVSRPAVILARAQAVSRGHTAIAEAAGQLLAILDKDVETSGAKNASLLGYIASAEAIKAVDWEDMPEGVIQLFPYGSIEGVDGRQYTVTDISMDMVPRLFAERKNPMLIDYEHNTYIGCPNSSLASGWILQVVAAKPAMIGDEATDETTIDEESLAAIEAELGSEAAARVRDQGPGLYALVRWTNKAAGHIQEREYAYLSPVFRKTENGEVLQLLSAGLTNDPNFEGMMPAAAKANHKDLVDSANAVTVGNAESNRESVDNSAKDTGGKQMEWKTLAEQTGITATSEEDFIAQATALRTSANEGAVATARVVELEGNELKRAATDDVNQAIDDKKLDKTQRDAFVAMAVKDRSQFDAIMATMQPMKDAEPDPGPKTPPQGKDTPDEGTEKKGAISLNFSTAGKHRVTPDSMARAEEFIARAKEAGGGNTAKGIRENSSVILAHLTS